MKRISLFLMLFNGLHLIKSIEKIKSPKISLTVSPLDWYDSEYKIKRQIILHYHDVDCYRMEHGFPFIGLYSHDPTKDLNNALFLYRPEQCPEGHVETRHSYPIFKFSKKWISSACLGFWAAYIEAGEIVHSKCLRAYPHWMYEMKDQIGNLSLNCLMLPGTHNSGCYYEYDKLRDIFSQKYLYTQEENVFTQLAYGIRYIDLRIWHENSWLWKSRITITHNHHHFLLPYMIDVLKQIKAFIQVTKEIVIIDFHRLISGIFMESLSYNQHKEIVKKIINIFGNYLIENKYKYATLNQLWKMDKRILITYAGPLQKLSNFLSPAIHHWWANTDKLNSLYKYFLKKACKDTSLSALSCVITLTTNQIITNIHITRRSLANKINESLNQWLREELSCANIILTEYFLGNNAIEIAIEKNRYHIRCSK